MNIHYNFINLFSIHVSFFSPIKMWTQHIDRVFWCKYFSFLFSICTIIEQFFWQRNVFIYRSFILLISSREWCARACCGNYIRKIYFKAFFLHERWTGELQEDSKATRDKIESNFNFLACAEFTRDEIEFFFVLRFFNVRGKFYWYPKGFSGSFCFKIDINFIF